MSPVEFTLLAFLVLIAPDLNKRVRQGLALAYLGLAFVYTLWNFFK